VGRSKRELSVIIVNYRSWTCLETCLQSLTPLADKYEILVVDNASNDGYLHHFVAKYPAIQFIESSVNLGFGGGNRLGVCHSAGDYFLFLNPDTIASEAAIDAMVKFLKTQNTYGIVSCRQHNNLGKHYLLFPNVLRLFGIIKSIESRTAGARFRIRKSDSYEFIVPDWVSGSVLMISRENYQSIGGWNPKFWLYYEDPDLCKRFADLGGKVALLTHVAIQHKHGGATRKDWETAALTKTEVTISRHVYIAEHFSGIGKMLSQSAMVLNYLIFGSLGALIGTLCFFVPELKLHRRIWLRRLRYYAGALKKHSWLSPNLPH
jgi:GT2 family glycosyltransferase